MHKEAIWKAAVVLLTMAAAVGCATLGKGPVDDRAQVTEVLNQWKQGVEAKNVDGVYETLSPNFTSSVFGDYSEFRESFAGFVEEGNLEGAAADLEGAQITIEDGKATVYPVDVEGGFGSATLRLQFQQVGGKWRIVSMEQA